MIAAPDRCDILNLIDQAVRAGARQAHACAVLNVTARTVQRWRHTPADRRPATRHEAPANKLCATERAAVLVAANRPGYASLTPHQIVPKLADEGIYLASESTFYRVLKEAGQGKRRGRSQAPQRRPITTHRATGPNQLWCWDITWMPSTVKGKYFYWYMMKDVFSRKLVVNEVHDNESSEHASHLLARGCLREQTTGHPLVLHSDNGTAMRGATMLTMMYQLGVEPSFSRPRVSNDNAYAEALFKTAKYCPMWPEKPFDTLTEAREWVLRFVTWYNQQHRHSRLKYVTPDERHRGVASILLENRMHLYAAARARNPTRWSRGLRNWKLNDVVYLNPEREQVTPNEMKKAE